MKLVILVSAFVGTVSLVASPSAHAQTLRGPSYAQRPAYVQVATLSAEPPAAVEHVPHRGRFSAGRFVVESLVGALAAAGVGYGTYRLACGEQLCVGGAVGGMLASYAVTPLVVWGIGNAMGGEGSLGSTYLGAAFPFSLSSLTPALGLIAPAIALSLMPFSAAGMYEASSHRVAVQREQEAPAPVAVRVGAAPLYGRAGSLAGGQLMLSGTF